MIFLLCFVSCFISDPIAFTCSFLAIVWNRSVQINYQMISKYIFLESLLVIFQRKHSEKLDFYLFTLLHQMVSKKSYQSWLKKELIWLENSLKLASFPTHTQQVRGFFVQINLDTLSKMIVSFFVSCFISDVITSICSFFGNSMK